MLRNITLALVILAAVKFASAGTGAALQLPVMPYDSLMEDRVSVDGYIDTEDEEYPGSFTNKATGITVYWGFDDSNLYIGLESKGKGWLAIGFGSDKMDEANMVIGRFQDDSTEVVNCVGANHTHAAANVGDSLLEDWEIDFDDETGALVMEFIYTLNWPGLKGTAVTGLCPGDTYDLLLARNARTAALTEQHRQQTQLKFQLAPNPHRRSNDE